MELSRVTITFHNLQHFSTSNSQISDVYDLHISTLSLAELRPPFTFPKMQLPISVVTAVITLLSPMLEAPSTTSSAPSALHTLPPSRAALPGSTIHCGTTPLSESDIVDAYLDLASHADPTSKYYLGSSSSAFGRKGGAQFYICNNARSKRFFTMDTKQLQDVKGTFEGCGSNSFWVYQPDNWSYGVDTNGNAECGGF